jgi:LAGLIDADG endonuclease
LQAVKIRWTRGQSAGKATSASAWNPQRLNVQENVVKLETQWIAGFVDGEGCFHVGINPHAEMKAGVQVLPEFTVVQHKRDVQILNALKAHFGCGVVRTNHGDRMAYRVRGQEHLLQIIIPFFMKHPLKTKKNVDFLKFRDCLLLMEKGDHLTPEGLEKIRTIAARMNRGAEIDVLDSFEGDPDLLE